MVHLRVFGHNALASYWLEEFENSTPAYICSLTNPKQLGICKTPAASQ
jgi:hypothetical protein